MKKKIQAKAVLPQREGLVIFSDFEPDAGLRRALELGRVEVLDVVRDSGLRGRGGAGFPAGIKWNLAATAQAEKKYVVCNADEGEPGTFKDRVLLSEYPRLMFEGMVIAAYAIGATGGFLYLRGEYKALLPLLQKTLKDMRKGGSLGEAIYGTGGFDFDIEIRLGVGAYVCGEETALIESLEGNRGESRNRPPFPVNTGYNGFPTIVNNVETFAAIPHIIAKGPQWFSAIGTEQSKGTKLLSVSGDCKKPGVYEVPFGIKIKDLMDMVKANNPKAVQIGGASGICLPKSKFNRRICFEDVPTGGSVIVFGQKRDMLAVADNFLEFFEEESCGQCTPCREGVPVLREAVWLLAEGSMTADYLKDMRSLAETMQDSSKCGLGQSAPNAFCSILDNFKNEYQLSTTPKQKKRFHG